MLRPSLRRRVLPLFIHHQRSSQSIILSWIISVFHLDLIQSVDCTVLNDKCSTDQDQERGRYHRYSVPSTFFPSSPHPTSRSTESIHARPFNRDGVAEIYLPVKNYPQRDCTSGRRRKPVQLPKLTGCAALHDRDDVVQDMTSFDAIEYSCDVGDYVAERPSVASVMRRKLDSADIHTRSPVNSTGVHIVIDPGNDTGNEGATYGDDVTVDFR